jgi:hypothetical protein
MILSQYVNRYRTLTTEVNCFPEHIDPSKMVFESYVKNNGVSRLKGLTIFNFTSITYVGDRNGFVQCIGQLNDKLETLIFKKE